MQAVSIENFNPKDTNIPIDSPRTLKSLEKLGFNINSLYSISDKEIVSIATELGLKNLDEFDFKNIQNEFEKHRIFKVEQVK